MVPAIPIIAELGLELAPVIIYGGYKTAEFLNKGGGQMIENMINQTKNNQDSKVKK